MFLKENNKKFTEYEEDKIYIKERRHFAEENATKLSLRVYFSESLLFLERHH
jgi:hypothetical protein